MALPETWVSIETMGSTTLPVSSHVVSVTIGSITASFTFTVSKQPSDTRSIASLATTFERWTLTFIVCDVTDYNGTTDPRTKFGLDYTTAYLKALRTLVFSGASTIPAPGTIVDFGGTYQSCVDTVDITQAQDKAVEVFLVTCNIKEVTTSGSGSTAATNEPKIARVEDVPPWQDLPEVVFEASTTEGMTLGFAYKTTDLDGDQKHDSETLRTKGLAVKDELVAIQNTAKDPFGSPPSFPKIQGTLKVKACYLRAQGTISVSDVQGRTNTDRISIDVGDAKLRFDKGTLSLSTIQVLPKLYKQPHQWLPGTKHPLNKTYGELFYGYSRTTANKVAVNGTSAPITVYKPVRYIEVGASFAYRPEGFGVWIANRGYEELDAKAAHGKKTIEDGKGRMKEGWLDTAGKKTKDKHLWLGFTTVLASYRINQLLNELLTPDTSFSWAMKSDGFGEVIKK